MFSRDYTIYRVPKSGGLRHELLYLPSGLLFDMSREYGVRIRGPLIPNFPDAEIRTIKGRAYSDLELIQRTWTIAEKRKYTLFYNCEHFVRDLIGIKPESPQLSAWVALGMIIFFGGLALRA